MMRDNPIRIGRELMRTVNHKQNSVICPNFFVIKPSYYAVLITV